jgi:hypothetical protein
MYPILPLAALVLAFIVFLRVLNGAHIEIERGSDGKIKSITFSA